MDAKECGNRFICPSTEVFGTASIIWGMLDMSAFAGPCADNNTRCHRSWSAVLERPNILVSFFPGRLL